MTDSRPWIVWDCAPADFPVTSFYGPFPDEATADKFRDDLERLKPTHAIEVWPLIDPEERKL